MTRTQRLLPYALLAALAPMALVGASSQAVAGDSCANHAQAQAPIESTQLLVVKFHADWCGSCVKLDEPLQRLQASAAGEPVDFVRLDLTDDGTRAVAADRASRLGLSEIYESYGGKTGFALLIDAESGTVLGKITSALDLEAMQALLGTSLEQAEA